MRLKKSVVEASRYQTSLGRDLNGLRLDRNERVKPFGPEFLSGFLKSVDGTTLPSSPETAALYEDIAGYHSRPVNELFIGAGITELLRVVLDFGCNEGDSVVCLDPTYPMYEIYAKLYGVDFRRVKLTSTDLKVSDITALVDETTQVVFLPNPNLPIETNVTVEFLIELRKSLPSTVTLFVDEAYYYFGSETLLGVDLPRTLVARTFSKAFGMAGIRLGYVWGDPDLITYISKSRSIVETNSLSIAAARWALMNLDEMQSYTSEVSVTRKMLADALKAKGLSLMGGIYTNAVMVDLERSDRAAALVQELRKQSVYIRGGFAGPLVSFVRVTIPPLHCLDEFLSRFFIALNANNTSL